MYWKIECYVLEDLGITLPNRLLIGYGFYSRLNSSHLWSLNVLIATTATLAHHIVWLLCIDVVLLEISLFFDLLVEVSFCFPEVNKWNTFVDCLLKRRRKIFFLHFFFHSERAFRSGSDSSLSRVLEISLPCFLQWVEARTAAIRKYNCPENKVFLFLSSFKLLYSFLCVNSVSPFTPINLLLLQHWPLPEIFNWRCWIVFPTMKAFVL